MPFEIIGDVESVEVIAKGHGVRERHRLRARYGGRRWRKLKGKAIVRLLDGRTALAEVHWFEAHGVGPVRWKIKRFLD